MCDGERVNYLKKLTISRMCAFLFYMNLASPGYLGIRLFLISDLLTVACLRNSNMNKNFKTRR